MTAMADGRWPMASIMDSTSARCMAGRCAKTAITSQREGNERGWLVGCQKTSLKGLGEDIAET